MHLCHYTLGRTWKFNQNAMEFLALLLRDDIAIPVSVVQLFTKHCVNDLLYVRKVSSLPKSSGFGFTGNSWYFTGYHQHILGKKSAIDQMFRLLFCLTSSQKQQSRESRSVSSCKACYVASAQNSQGLYFCSKVWAFSIFSGSHAEIIFRLFSLRTKQMEKKWK